MVYPKPSDERIFGTADVFILCLITIISFLVRLWKLGYPNDIVYHEVYFLNFTGNYINNEYFSDNNPPLGKMIIAMFAKLSHFPENSRWRKRLNTNFNQNQTFYVNMRMCISTVSSLCPPLIYSACRCFKLSHASSISATALICFDFASIIQGRFILSDGILHFFTCLHIFSLSCFFRNPSHRNTMLVGFSIGCAISCKYFLLGILVLDGLTQLYWIVSEFPSFKSIIIRAFEIFVPCASVIFCSWVLHFIFLPYNVGNVPVGILNSTLIEKSKENITYWGQRINQHMLRKISNLNIEMHKSNMRVTTPHPWSSSPKYWPLLLDKHVLFFSKDEGKISIRCICSPVSCWVSTLGLILTASLLLFKLLDFRNFVFFAGWVLSYFPFIFIPHVGYIYHYIIPLIFASLNNATFLEKLLGKKGGSFMNIIIATLAILCFLFFYPWIYGTYCPNWESTRLWTNRWLQGTHQEFGLPGASAFTATKVIREDFPN